jgi:hypothetical protein
VRGRNELDNPSEWIVIIHAPAAGNIQSFMAQFADEPTITGLGEPATADLAGYPGLQQDFAALPNPDFSGNPNDDIPPGVVFIEAVEQFFVPGFIWVTSTPEALLRFVVVDAGDGLLFVYFEAPPADFEALSSDADLMLQTLAPESP